MSEGQAVGPLYRLPPEDLGPTLVLFAGQVALACAQAEDTLGSETSGGEDREKSEGTNARPSLPFALRV